MEVPLALIQRSVEEINKAYAPRAPTNRRFSVANVIVIVLGTMIILLAAVEPYLPDPPEVE
jgi:hypothetical protein